MKKRVLCLLLATLLLLTACGKKEEAKTDPVPTTGIDGAKALIEAGDYAAAYQILREYEDIPANAEAIALRDGILYCPTETLTTFPDGTWIKVVCEYTDDGRYSMYDKTDSEGNWSRETWTYNKAGQMLTHQYSDSKGETDEEYCTYDKEGRVLESLIRGVRDSYTYDSKGRLLEHRKGDTVWEAYTYDSKGNVLTHTDGNYFTTYTYDAKGRITKAMCPTIETLTGWILPTDTATYCYDSKGNLTEIRYVYFDTYKAFEYYDAAGNRTSLEIICDEDSVWNPGIQYQYTYSYDAEGRVIRINQTVSYPDGTQETNESRYLYDAEGNEIDPDTTYNEAGQVTYDGSWTYTYDEAGHLISQMHDLSGYDYTYDENGLLATVTLTDGDYQTVYTYDRGALTMIEEHTAYTRRTVCDVDADGFKVKETFYDDDLMEYEETYQYCLRYCPGGRPEQTVWSE